MRISTAHQYGTYSQNIAEAQQHYLKLQAQIGSGKRLLNPSDDPGGMSVVVSMKSIKAAAERYQQNIDHGTTILKFSEQAYDETNTLLRRAYQFAVQGANGATDQTGREAMVREVTEIQRRLVEIGNTRGANNDYIFSGQRVDTKPFTQNATDITFNGDANALSIETGPGEIKAIGQSASQMFIDAYAALESLKNNLQGGNTGALSGMDIPAIQGAMDDFNRERGGIGAKLQQLTQQKTDYQRRIDELSVGISNVEDVDLAEAMVEYQLAETAYTAALNVASQGFGLSLMDFIRG